MCFISEVWFLTFWDSLGNFRYKNQCFGSKKFLELKFRRGVFYEKIAPCCTFSIRILRVQTCKACKVTFLAVLRTIYFFHFLVPTWCYFKKIRVPNIEYFFTVITKFLRVCSSCLGYKSSIFCLYEMQNSLLHKLYLLNAAFKMLSF